MEDRDFWVELENPEGAIYRIEDRVSLEEMSGINLGVERNLHQFRAGDLTLVLENKDEFFDELFDGIKASDRWRVRVYRGKTRYFNGAIWPSDDIHFERGSRTLELTALDIVKLYEEVDATGYKRTTILYSLNGSHAAGVTTLTLNGSTNGLFNGDEIKIIGSAFSEVQEIGYVLNATQVVIKAPLVNSYTSGNTVFLNTPYHRFRKPSVIISDLLDLAGIVARNVDLNGPPGKFPTFSDQSSNKLALSTADPTNLTARGAQEVICLAGPLTYQQLDPDDDWTAAGTNENLVDWTQSLLTEPGTIIRVMTGAANDIAYDWTVGTYVAWGIDQNDNGVNNRARLLKATSADGLTWSAFGVERVLHSIPTGSNFSRLQIEFDQDRGLVYYSTLGNSQFKFGKYNPATLTQTDLTTAYSAISMAYSRTAGGIILHTTDGAAPGTIIFWEGDSPTKSFKPTGMDLAVGSTAFGRIQTRFNGSIWVTGSLDSAKRAVLYISSDYFNTIRKIILSDAPGGLGPTTMVGTSFRVAYKDESQTWRLITGAPYYAGVVPYMDCENKSVVEALDDLAVVLNSVFSIDEEERANFVVRDNAIPPATDDPLNLTGLIVAQSDDPIWIELYDFVEVSGPDGKAEAGTRSAVSRTLSIDTDLAVSRAVLGGIANFLLEYFSKVRRYNRISAPDPERPLRLMQAVFIDSIEWRIWEISYALPTFELEIGLLEKVP